MTGNRIDNGIINSFNDNANAKRNELLKEKKELLKGTKGQEKSELKREIALEENEIKKQNTIFQSKEIKGNEKTPTEYASIKNLFDKYAGEDGTLQAEEIKQMKADFEASGINQIKVGDSIFNIIDANKDYISYNTVTGTEENDIIFGHTSGKKGLNTANSGLRNFEMQGGTDIYLDPYGTAPNSVEILKKNNP